VTAPSALAVRMAAEASPPIIIRVLSTTLSVRLDESAASGPLVPY